MFSLIILGLILVGCSIYLFKYGLAKKKTGFAIIKDKGSMDGHGNMSVQGLQINGKTFIRITVLIENKKAELDIPQEDFHKYNVGHKLAVEYRVNKLGTITSVKQIKPEQAKPIIIKINEKPTSNKYTSSNKDYWS